MSRLKERTVLGRIYRFLSLVFKNLLNIVTMRRLLTRVINRVLLRELLTPAMGIEAVTEAHGRRRMVSLPPLHILLLSVTQQLRVGVTWPSTDSPDPLRMSHNPFLFCLVC